MSRRTISLLKMALKTPVPIHVLAYDPTNMAIVVRGSIPMGLDIFFVCNLTSIAFTLIALNGAGVIL